MVSKEFFLGYSTCRCNTTIGIEHTIFFAPCGYEYFAITPAVTLAELDFGQLHHVTLIWPSCLHCWIRQKL